VFSLGFSEKSLPFMG